MAVVFCVKCLLCSFVFRVFQALLVKGESGDIVSLHKSCMYMIVIFTVGGVDII